MSLLLEVASPESRYRAAVDRLVRQRDALTARQVRALYATLADVRRRAVADLAMVGGDTFTAAHLGRLRDATDAAAAELVRRWRPLLNGALSDAWQAGAAFQPAALGAIGIDLPITGVSLDQLLAAQETAGRLISRVGADFQARTAGLVTRAVAGGLTPHQLRLAVADLLRTQPGRRDPRLGSITHQAEVIQRTEMLRSFALADERRVQQVAETTPGLLKVWDAVGDRRTRPDHAAAGRRYSQEGAIPVDEDFVLGGHRCSGPHDPRLPPSQTVLCRCVRRLWSEEWGRSAAPESAAAPEPQPFDSVKDAHEWAGDKFKPWREGLTPAENDAIRGYQSTTYGAINTALRNNDREAIAARKDQIGHLDRALAKSPLDRGVVVHRFYAGRAAAQLARPDRQVIGAEFSDPAFLSTSFDRSHVHKWAGYAISEGRSVVIAEIRVPAGTKAGYLGKGFLGGGIDTEYELLVARGARFRTVEVGEDSFLDYDGKRHTVKKVVLEVVG